MKDRDIRLLLIGESDNGVWLAMDHDLLARASGRGNEADLSPNVLASIDDANHHGANGTGCSNKREIWL